MYNLSDDKVLSTDLVHSFPKKMILEIEKVLVNLSKYDIKGIYAIKGISDHYQVAFNICKTHKLIFDYDKDENLSLTFMTINDEKILSVNSISDEDKINLIVEVITETIYKDNLISNSDKRKK